MRTRGTRVRFLRGTDRDGRRYEAGEVATVNWKNLDDLARWGVLAVLPPEQPAREEVTEDGGIPRQEREVL